MYELKFEKTRLKIKNLSSKEINRKKVFFPQGSKGHRYVSFEGLSASRASFEYGEYDENGSKLNTSSFAIDTSETTTLVYRGMVIEIDQVTSSKIVYRLVRSFQE